MDQAPWVEGQTIGEALLRTARLHPDLDALVFPSLGLRLTYEEFSDQVERVGRGLLHNGLGPGDHLAIWATNVPEWVLLQMAAARIGAVLVTINPAYRIQELRFALKQCDASALFLIDRFKTSDYHAMINEVCPELSSSRPGRLRSRDFPRLRWVVNLAASPLAGALPWSDLLKSADGSPLCVPVSPRDPANIQYTSGTTGLPKAAVLTHRNLLLNAYYVGRSQRIVEGDRICIPVPFYHCFGCVLGTLCAVVHGAAMVIPQQHFDPLATLDAIEQERATAIYGVPTMFIALLEHPSLKGRDLSSLRTGIMAGSPCPVEVMRKVIDVLGARELTIAYGLTETSPVVTQTQVDDPLDVRVETVGRPIPGADLKIVDPASGRELEDGEQGELCARGHVVMRGYYKDGQATRSVIDREGWLHSGDLAIRRSDGCYRITGRIKDMVIRGGENIYPREIEEFLFSHPAVEQVAVVGVPDARFGEELCAWIQLRGGARVGADEIRRYCRKHLAHFKTPRYVRFVDSFPQTVTGKIQKFKIREAMEEELKSEDQASTLLE